MADRLHLQPRHRQALEALLREHLPDIEVWAYGSRVNGRSHDGSDLDLVLRGPGLAKIPGDQLEDFEEAVRESSIPFLVEARDWARLPERFHREIERGYVVLTGVLGGHHRTDARPRVALGNIIDLTLSSVDKKTKQDEHVVYLCNYTDVYYNNFIHGNMRFMEATATNREIAKCSLFAGDIVITKDSEKYDDIGVPALVRENIPNLVCGYHLAILRASPQKTDGTYLFYALTTDDARSQFHSFANGITRFGLRKADIGLVEIPLPPLAEQRAVAYIFRTLDDKIELNHRMNETLEAVAEATFKDWFVDFGPTRAKANGRDPYLPSEIWNSFPDRLIDSELGKIPEGWKVKQLKNLARISSGKRPSEHYSVPSEEACIPLWGGNGPVAFVSKPLLTQPILLTGRVGTLGKVFRVTSPCWPSDNTLVINPVMNNLLEYLMFQLRRFDFETLNRGSTQPLLAQSDLKLNPVLLPAPSSLKLFNAQVRNVYARHDQNTLEIRTLATLRDILLPKLLSGKVQVTVLQESTGKGHEG